MPTLFVLYFFQDLKKILVCKCLFSFCISDTAASNKMGCEIKFEIVLRE